MTANLRIGIVGCGAVTELAHLPICTNTNGVSVVALIDPNIDRARRLASIYQIPKVLNGYEQLGADVIDAAIVAVPHALHERIASPLLRKGVHVLVEKPMALSATECDRMIESAAAGKAVLSVGLMRRFAPWARFIKLALAANVVGRLRSFEIREGFIYCWPVASDFFFRKESAGGGVLIDTGAHTLDTVLWWFGDPVRVDYADDAEGGVEADCLVELTYENDVKGRIELSRTRGLGNQIRIIGEDGAIEVAPNKNSVRITYQKCQLAGRVECMMDKMDCSDYLPMMAASLDDWFAAIRTGRVQAVDGREGRRSVALIEACYAARKDLVYPWFCS